MDDSQLGRSWVSALPCPALFYPALFTPTELSIWHEFIRENIGLEVSVRRAPGNGLGNQLLLLLPKSWLGFSRDAFKVGQYLKDFILGVLVHERLWHH